MAGRKCFQNLYKPFALFNHREQLAAAEVKYVLAWGDLVWIRTRSGFALVKRSDLAR